MTVPRFFKLAVLLVGGMALPCSGCGTPEGEVELPEVDAEVFAATVYPTLLADCAFSACHGSHDRFFSVFGPGRTRLDPASEPYDPATPEELALTFTRARSMLMSEEGPARSPLLRKPLAIQAGGAPHKGDDPWGQAIYPSKQDERYKTLFFWATTPPEKP